MMTQEFIYPWQAPEGDQIELYVEVTLQEEREQHPANESLTIITRTVKQVERIFSLEGKDVSKEYEFLHANLKAYWNRAMADKLNFHPKDWRY